MVTCGKDPQGRRTIPNPDTGRCVLRDGAKGREILARGGTTTIQKNQKHNKKARTPSSPSMTPSSASYSYTPRRYRHHRSSRSWLPMRMLGMIFAVALAIKVMQWGRVELGKWRNLITGLLPSIHSAVDKHVSGFVERVVKKFHDSAEIKSEIPEEKIKKYYDACCAAYFSEEQVPKYFWGSVKKTVKDIDDACKIPTTPSIVKRWYQIIDDVKKDLIDTQILYVMKETLEHTKNSNLPMKHFGGVAFDVLDLRKQINRLLEIIRRAKAATKATN